MIQTKKNLLMKKAFYIADLISNLKIKKKLFFFLMDTLKIQEQYV